MLPPAVPDLRSLDLYLSVVKLGSLSLAAKAHQLAQPTASERIRRLERRLGVELLTRSPSGSVPTAAGVLVAEWATTVVQAAHDLAAGIGTLREDAEERLQVAASYTLAEHILPAWLQALHRRRPSTTVRLEVENSSVVIERVRAAAVDIGFIESPGGTLGLRATDVGEDELALVVAPSHPWARRRRPLPARALAGTPLILREDGSGTRESLAAALAAAGLGPPTPELQLGSTSAIKGAVAAGAGAAVISRLAVDSEVASGRLVEVAVAGLDLRRRLRAVWPARAPHNPAVSALIDVATAAAGSNDR